ncbi:endonuclease/exonuclease/phosphatase family protein [Niameybacter massiliensis]|uniref:endonuclease/exonuclease/phosphatase family protein n=1 Tax=Niameybacter massiliensis TaxID=1658108 RepID=UPI0006B5A871|nr:endonuclease/exonuclease/phosphatase family protein [Niameybacter massiliensis]
MKLLTLNCHSWQEEEQAYKLKCLAKQIKEEGYDVIALQEVSQHQNGKIVRDNLKEGNYLYALLDELKQIGVTDYDYAWAFSHIGYEVYEEGLGILTKHPIYEKEEFFITNGTDTNYWKTRRIIKVTIQYNEELIDFYSCHLGWWNDEEESFKFQVDRLDEEIKNGRLAFLMGDFNNNANTRSEGYDYMLSKGWQDTYTLARNKDSGVTVLGKIDGWEENKQQLRIDLVWSSQPVEVISSQVCFNGENQPIVSDHFGVEVKIQK